MPKILRTKSIKNSKRKDTNPIIAFILCALKGLVICFLGFAGVSLAIYKGNEFSFFWKMLLYVFVLSGGLYSGYSSHKRNRGRGFISGLIGSSIYVLMIVVVSAIMMRLQLSSNILIVIPIGVVGGLIGGIVGANSK